MTFPRNVFTRTPALIFGGFLIGAGLLTAGYFALAASLTNTNVEPTVLNTGATTNATVSFQTTTTIPANGKVKVIFPGGFNVANVNGANCGPSMDGGFTFNISGQTVTILRDGNGTPSTGGSKTCNINGIKNPSVVGSTGNYQIETRDNADTLLDADANVAADTITASLLTGTNVEPNSLTAGATGTVTVSFTTINSLEGDGKIIVGFPAGFNIAGANNPNCGLDGSLGFNVNGQNLTLNRSGGTIRNPGPITCTIQNITNPGTPGSTGTYSIQTTNNTNNVHDADMAVAADTITAPSLTSTDIALNANTTGATVTVTASFTTTHTIPANGKIRVTFPVGFAVGGATGGACSTMDGTFVTSFAGSQVILTRQNDGTPQTAAAETCTFTGVKNPTTNGNYPNYTIETLNSDNSVIDSDSSVAGDNIVAASLTSTNVQPASLVASATGNVTVTFTTVNTLEDNGKIVVQFPAGFNVSAANNPNCSSMNGSFAIGVNNQQVTITRSGGNPAAPGAHTCVIGNITNPAALGVTGSYQIQTTNNTNQLHDIDNNVPGDTITGAVNPLSSTNVQPGVLNAGTPSTVTVTFTTVSAIPNNGKVRVTFPTGFNVANVNAANCGPSMDGNFTFGFAGQQVIITRNGGTSSGSGAKSCTIGNIINPATAGSTGTYGIETLDGANNVLDADMAVTADTIVAGVLSSTNVQPASLVAGSVNAVTVTFTTVNAIENNGKINVTFPAGFNVAGVNGVNCGPSMDGSFTFGVAGQVVTINRNGGTKSDPGAKSCSINNVTNPSIAGSTGTYGITTTDNAGNLHDADNAVTADTITAATLTGTNVQPATLNTGASSTVTVSFTTINSLELDGKIKVTFPAGFNVSGVNGANCGPSMDGSFTFGVAGQEVTINRNSGTKTNPGAKTCTINNVFNPSIVGSTGTYAITTTDAAGNVHDTDAAVAADTIVASALTGTNVQPASLAAGASSTVTVSFTTVNAIKNNGKIKVTFPAGFNVAGAAGASCTGMDGSFATGVSGQIVTITRSGGTSAAAGAKSCTINSIVNPGIVGSTGTYNITTTDGGDNVQDVDNAVAADTITAGALTGTNVEPATLNTGATGTTTVTFTTTNTIEANGKIKVTFPAGFNVAGVNGVNCGPSMDGSFTFGVSGQDVTINRNSGSPTAPGAKSCTIGNITNPSIIGSTGTYAITTTDNAGNAHDTDAAVAADTIVASALTGTNVQPASLIAGATSTATVSFTTVNAIKNNGKITVTFPSGFNVAGANNASCTGMDGNFATGVAGQIVTITRSAGTSAGAGAKTCTIDGIVNPGIAGSTGTYAISTTDNGNNLQDIDNAVAADTITAGALTGTNVQPATLNTGATGTATVTFTTANTIEANGKIKVTFPAGFTVSGVNGVSCSPSMDGSFTFGVAGQDVTINRNSGSPTAPGAKSCTIGGVVNPSTVGSTGNYAITTTDNAGNTHDTDAAVAADTIVASALTSTNVQPASLAAGATSTVTVSFTTVNTIKNNGKIIVDFPGTFNVAGATNPSCSPSMDGNFAVGVAGHKVTITRSAGTSSNPGAKTCTIDGIVNPGTAGSTGMYTITTANSAGDIQDTDASVTADVIDPGALTGTNVEPATLNTGAAGTATVSFTTANAIENNGKIVVVFPAGFNVASINSASCAPSMDGNFTFGVSGQTVTITRNSGSSTAAGAKTCTLGNVINPSIVGSTGTYTITTKDSVDNVHDTATVAADTIVASALTSTNVQPTSLTAGATTTATISFTTVSTLASTGKVKVAFPSGFNVAGASTPSCSPSMDGSFAVGVSGQTVTITRSGGNPSGAGAKTCTVAGIVNPTIAGSTGTYAITTTDSSDVVQDTDAAVAADTIVAAALTGTNVEPASLSVGATGTATVTFTTVNAIEANGKIKVTFGAGFNVAGASGATCSASMDGSFATSVSGQTVIITRSGGNPSGAGAKTCTIGNITNPGSAGSTGTYTIATTNNADATHDIDTAVAADTIAVSVGSLTGVNVTPGSLVAGATSTVTLEFVTETSLEANGKVKVTFPSGFTVSGANAASCSPSMDGNFATSVSGQTVIITRSGGSPAGAGAKTCTIAGIVNPTVAGSTGTYAMTTTDGSDALHDSDGSVAADTIVAATLTSTNVEPATLTASESGTATVSFTTVNALEADGKVKVTFPAGFNVSGASGATCSPSMNGSFVTSVSGQTVTITRSGGGSAGAGAKTCTIGSVVNPSLAGSTGTYTITTTNNADAVHDTDAAVAADVIVLPIGTLTNTSVTPASLIVSTTSTVTVTFTTVNTLEDDGKIRITFPTGFDVSRAISGTCSTMNGSFATGVDGQTVILVRSGGSPVTAGAQTCTIGSITAPTDVGTTGTYTITTTNAADTTHDTGTAAGSILRAQTQNSGGTTNVTTTTTSTGGTTTRTPAATYAIEITSPKAGESFDVNTPIDVTWSTAGGSGIIGAVNLYYSIDGGKFWTTIVTNTENDGRYGWILPSKNADEVTLKIEGTDLTTVLASDLLSSIAIVGGADSTGSSTDSSADTTTDTTTDTGTSTDTSGSPSETPTDANTGSGSSSNTIALTAGMLVRGYATNSVFYLDTDNTLRPFLDSQTYFTYADSFDVVVQVPDDQLSLHPIGNPMLPKAGTVLVKVPSERYVYAVENVGGAMTLHWITTEAIASAMYGDGWSKYVLDILANAWKHYVNGTDIVSPNDITVDPSIMHTRDELNSK